MRLTSFILSLLIHLSVVALGLYLPSWGQSTRIDLDKPVYEVDLVRMPKQRVAPQPKKAPEKKTASKTRIKQPEQPKPKARKPEAGQKSRVAALKRQSPPEPEKTKIPRQAPKKKRARSTPQKKRSPRSEPERSKPQAPTPAPTQEKVRSEALEEIMKGVQEDEKQERQYLAGELASLRKEAGPAGNRSGARRGSSRVGEIYGRMVEARIKKHWRYPRVETEGNLVAEVRIGLDSAGAIKEVTLISSSGRSDFDRSVLRAVEEAEGLPAPPRNDLNTIEITFSLQEKQE
jgi:colicin import membrane protein